ncbi:MAG TPA: integrase arm-type DNA-binding domain-containing protein [Sphingobium sp.]|uniref:tyrosine-type recombinase/integrase n=1 Tax=Sphingobium sp. TaxID=1912891 RepID=UPI002ED0EE6A
MLTDAACRSARTTDKPLKLFDAHGLYLHVKKTGLRAWRLKYRFDGKEQLLTIGNYPDTSLRDAREARDDARKLLRHGSDPRLVVKLQTAQRKAATENSFETIAREWLAVQSEILTERYAGQILDRLEADVFPTIGALPIESITPALVLAVCRMVEDRGAIEMAKRVRQHMSAVFIYAIGLSLVDADPAAIIKSALRKRLKKARPALVELKAARAMLMRVEAQEKAYVVTKLASRLLALTAVRPGVLRLAEPCEFEDLSGPEPIWRIPAEKMKLTREKKEDAAYEFIVPLSRQAVETVKAAMKFVGNKPYLFRSSTRSLRPISDSTISKLYRTAGFAGKHVPHGWRSSFSTIMNMMAALESRHGDREVVDLMLAHEQEGVELIYNRYGYMQRRREIAQEWADMITDGMKPAWTLLQLPVTRHDRAHIRRDRAGHGRPEGIGRPQEQLRRRGSASESVQTDRRRERAPGLRPHRRDAGDAEGIDQATAI